MKPAAVCQVSSKLFTLASLQSRLKGKEPSGPCRVLRFVTKMLTTWRRWRISKRPRGLGRYTVLPVASAGSISTEVATPPTAENRHCLTPPWPRKPTEPTAPAESMIPKTKMERTQCLVSAPTRRQGNARGRIPATRLSGQNRNAPSGLPGPNAPQLAEPGESDYDKHNSGHAAGYIERAQ